MAVRLDGKALAEKLRGEIKERVKKSGIEPHLAIVKHGSTKQMETYISMKMMAASEAGFKVSLYALEAQEPVEAVIKTVRDLNNDEKTHGILVQLPLASGGPDAVAAVMDTIAAEKDVDGFHRLSIAALHSRYGHAKFEPCTPAGIIRLIQSTGVDLTGLHAVVLGRSDVVGTPVCSLLRRLDCTVTQCHSRTRNIQSFIKQADILVAAIGQPEFVSGEWIKPGAIVIDVGTNFVPDATKKSGQRLCGDVHYASASLVAGYISPVPGGVGPMTIASLMENTARAAGV